MACVVFPVEFFIPLLADATASVGCSSLLFGVLTAPLHHWKGGNTLYIQCRRHIIEEQDYYSSTMYCKR